MLDPPLRGGEGGTNKAPLRCQGGDLAGPGCGCLAPGGEAADVPTAPPRPCVQRYWLTGAPPGVRRRWRENAGGGGKRASVPPSLAKELDTPPTLPWRHQRLRFY